MSMVFRMILGSSLRLALQACTALASWASVKFSSETPQICLNHGSYASVTEKTYLSEV